MRHWRTEPPFPLTWWQNFQLTGTSGVGYPCLWHSCKHLYGWLWKSGHCISNSKTLNLEPYVDDICNMIKKGTAEKLLEHLMGYNTTYSLLWNWRERKLFPFLTSCYESMRKVVWMLWCTEKEHPDRYLNSHSFDPCMSTKVVQMPTWESRAYHKHKSQTGTRGKHVAQALKLNEIPKGLSSIPCACSGCNMHQKRSSSDSA